MFSAYLVVTVVTALSNAAIAAADLRAARFVLANSTAVAVPRSWLPMLGGLKAAGALGLLVGIVGTAFDQTVLSDLGVAAAIGLVLFFLGALLVHVRARVLHNLYGPGCFWLLSIASLVLLVEVQ